VTEQLDQLGQFVVRDLLPELGYGLERNFPGTAAALPRERWRQVGWTLLGLTGVYWIAGLGPELAQSLVWLAGIGVGGYTGWHVLRHWRQARRDDTAHRFTQHAADLSAEDETARIAALASLDQLAYDNPRYRLALVSLLSAALQQRAADGARGGSDAAVVVQMLAEFRLLLMDQPERETAAAEPAQAVPNTGVASAPDTIPAVAEVAPPLEIVRVQELSEPDPEADGGAVANPQRAAQ
jgi:hypothetical protein